MKALKQRVDSKITQYKMLMNDKSALFEEMYSRALLMINRDLQIIKNEEEIVHLKHEIDINILEIEQKHAIIEDLHEELKVKKATYKALKQDIKELEEQCDELNAILKEKDAEFQTLEEVSRDRDVEILGLEKTLGEKAPVLNDAEKYRKVNEIYKFLKGDVIDVMIAEHLSKVDNQVPIKRLGNGFYMFGTRKIFVKVLNHKLVVRMGGGSSSFPEFYDTYGLAELKKVSKLQDLGQWDYEAYAELVESPSKKKLSKENSGSR